MRTMLSQLFEKHTEKGDSIKFVDTILVNPIVGARFILEELVPLDRLIRNEATPMKLELGPTMIRVHLFSGQEAIPLSFKVTILREPSFRIATATEDGQILHSIR